MLNITILLALPSSLGAMVAPAKALEIYKRINVALEACSSVDHFGQICSFNQACMNLDIYIGELKAIQLWLVPLLPVYVIISQNLKIDV